MAPLNLNRSSSSSSSSSIIQHLSHPKHPLHLLDLPHDFFCNACSVLGSGPRYHCHACDFDLHQICATCPAAVISPLHHHHLTLVNKPVYNTCCDLCGDLVHGLFYTCSACMFDVHPLCTKLPLYAQHHNYLFKLQPGDRAAACAVCYEPCTSWRYRCEAPSLDIHLECALEGCDDKISKPTAAYCQIRSAVPPPQQAGYGGCAVGIPIGGGGGYGFPGQPGKTEGYGHTSGGGSGRKRRMFCYLGKIAATAVITSIVGLPFGI